MDYIKVSKQPERRVCARNVFARKMSVMLDNGVEITGVSNDVSLGGLSLDVVQIPKNIAVGQIGKLYIQLPDGNKSRAFMCCVARINGNSIGVQINKNDAATFGITLTKNLFKRKSSGGNDVHKNR